MENMETIMVNLASPAARRALGRTKDIGQKTAVKTEHQRRTSTAIRAAAGVSPKKDTTGPAAKKRDRLSAPMDR